MSTANKGEDYVHICGTTDAEGLSHGTVKAYLLAGKGGPRGPEDGGHVTVGSDSEGAPEAEGRAKISQVAEAMTFDVLEALRRSWSKVPGGGDARMLWATATLCLFGLN